MQGVFQPTGIFPSPVQAVAQNTMFSQIMTPMQMFQKPDVFQSFVPMAATAQQMPFMQGTPNALDRRDSSISSSMSSSSHQSSASSKDQSSQQSNTKYLIAAAIHRFNLLQTEPERRLHLIENASLFARDKTGCQLLQNKITEDVTLMSEQEDPVPS